MLTILIPPSLHSNAAGGLNAFTSRQQKLLQQDIFILERDPGKGCISHTHCVIHELLFFLAYCIVLDWN